MTAEELDEVLTRAAIMGLRPTPPVALPNRCVCGHFESEHSIELRSGEQVVPTRRTCWATVWLTFMRNDGSETRPLADYCPCHGYEQR